MPYRTVPIRRFAGRALGVIAIASIVLVGCATSGPDAIREAVVIEAGTGDAELRPFYEGRDHRPVWTDWNGLTDAGTSLVETLCGVDTRGFPGARLPAIRERMARAYSEESEGEERARAIAELEMLLSRALVELDHGMRRAPVELPHVLGNWRQPDLPPPPTSIELLERFTSAGDVGEAMKQIYENRPGYHELAAALVRYREIEREGGWPAVPAGPERIDDSDPSRIEALRARLAATGDLASGASDLDAALRAFQSRHGLEPTGALDADTLAAMNVPLAQRIGQLEVNLERQRSLPRREEPRRIVVNIPSFELRAYDGGELAFTMPVIVGKRMNQTPVFADKMTYVSIRPYWNVPESIAVDELLPKIAKDPAYLAAHGYEIVDAEGNVVDAYRLDGEVRDTATGDGDEDPDVLLASRRQRGRDEGRAPQLAEGLAEGTLRLRQKSGSGNALGLVKFMFPNEFNVYLHDTPEDHLFERTERGFSHGCIRVQDPTKLAEYVLGPDGWSRDEIVQAMQDPAVTAREVPLEQPIPVYIVYLTAWVDEEGRVQFREDVYGHDADVRAALAGTALTETERATCEQIRDQVSTL
jgi:murein L,D-transpeptidase YcbB/YkuD